MKFKEKIRAIRLRKLGKSYREIRKQVKVSKGTLTLWLRDIKLTSEQQKRIDVELKQKNAYRLGKANREKRIKITKQIIESAKKEVSQRLKNPLFPSGLMLYWAEGDKSETQESVKFSNSDPEMIKLMMRWFREVCMVPEKKFKIALHIHKLFCRQNIEKFWSKITGVPRNQFHKTQVKPTSLRQRKNKLYNGTCAIRVEDRSLFRRIRGWKMGFLEEINKDL